MADTLPVRRESQLFNSSNLTLMEIIRVIFWYFVRNYNATQAFIELRENCNEAVRQVLPSELVDLSNLNCFGVEAPQKIAGKAYRHRQKKNGPTFKRGLSETHDIYRLQYRSVAELFSLARRQIHIWT